MHRVRRSPLVLGVALCALVGVSLARAQAPPRVVINEVLYDASGTDTGQEWIELANGGAEPADVGGWSIERGGKSFERVFTVPEGTTIAPGGFLLVGESAVSGAQLAANLAFQNGGDATDGIRLTDAVGKVVDVLLYDVPNTNGLPDESGALGTSFAPDVAEGHSLARVTDGTDTNASGADFRDVRAPSPGGPNASASPEASVIQAPAAGETSGVIVNEMLPDPVGSDADGEFVELFNPTSAEADLGGLKLDDADGGSTPFSIMGGTVIAGGGYLVFTRKETGLALNNEGDDARLLAADGQILSSMQYARVPREGAAWARRMDGSAEWTLTPTPGAANVFVSLPSRMRGATDDVSPAKSSSLPRSARTASPSPAPRVVTLAGARQLPVGSAVQAEGVVSAPPGLLGAGIFYLSGSGIQVFVSAGEPLALALGDRVSVRGVRSASSNEARIRAAAADVQKIGAGEPPSARTTTTGGIGEELEGTLVRIQGAVARLSGNSFLVDDGSGPVRVLVKKTTGWTRPPLRRGQNVTVTGIVSQSGETYRLLPRFSEDLVIGGEVAGAEVSARESATRDTLGSDRRSSTSERAESEETDEGEVDAQSVEPAPPSPTAISSSAATASPLRLSTPALFAWGAAGLLGLFRLLYRR